MPGSGQHASRGRGFTHRLVAALGAALLIGGLAVSPALAAAPVAEDDSASVRRDKVLDVFLNAFDDDFDDLTFSVTDPPDHGDLDPADCADGFCTYTPDPGFVGSDSFQWKVNDGTTDSNTATFSIDVTENTPPVAEDDDVTVLADEPTNLFFDAFDDDGDDLTVVIVSGPDHGDLTDCFGHDCTYTPDPGFTGDDVITWRADDGLATSNLATLTITVREPECAHAPGICIDNGTVQLGINPEGHLNVEGDIASSSGTLPVGLRYLTTGAEATAPGCLCEGWGAADATTGTTGYANVSSDFGVNGMTLESFTHTASTAVSTVNIGDTLRVIHDFHPSANANLYEVEVTIENISASPVDARYRRVMDWDVEPTAFAEFVTIETGGSTALLFTSDDGFASANPLDGPSEINFSGEAVDDGPADHGALFDFGFGILPAGESTTFSIFYGAAGTEAAALAAMTQIHAEVYSFGQPSTEDGPSLGTPNTFIFAFGGVGGDPLNNPPVAVDDTATTAFGTATDVDVLGNDSDPDGDPLIVTQASDPAHGSTSINPDGTVKYTPDPGYSGPDSFTYTIDDGHGGTDTATVTMTVEAGPNNAPPTVVAGEDKGGTEGSAITLDGTVTNPEAGDTVTQTWSYSLGAGTDAGMTCQFANANAVDTTITCTDDGTVTVKLTANDGVNPPVEDTATLTIANADPSVSITSPADGASFQTGVTVDLSATISDPGANDTHTCTIDWGDGTSGPGVVAGGVCTGSHAYTTASPRTITVTAVDDDGGDGTDTVGLTITTPPANPAPTVDAGANKGGTEGSAISLDGTVTNEPAGDTVTHSWSYSLGAGTDAGMTCQFANANAVDTTITCDDDGTVTVKLTANDGVNPPVEDTATLTIANADPSVSITAPDDGSTVNVGANINLSAAITDPGDNDTHTCTIDWGDGTSGPGVVAGGTCTGSHQYAGIGVPTITVTVTDDDGGDDTDEIMLVVTLAQTKVTGGGWISTATGKLRFGFVAHPTGGGEGEIQVRWGGHRFHGKTVSGLAVAKPQASWSGTGRYDGTAGYTYQVTVVDNGNGGGKKKTPDSINIVIRDASGAVVLSASGSLGGGNIKIH